jgi:hypothetical protein
MMLPDLADIEEEFDYAKSRISWGGEGRRRSKEWIGALEQLIKALKEYEEHPVEVNLVRADAAVREAQRIAQAAAWSVVKRIVSCLQEDTWAWDIGLDEEDEGIKPGESFASWAARNPGREIWLKNEGEDGIEISQSGTKVSVWAAAVPVYKEEPDFIFDTIPLDQLSSWKPPELSSPNQPDFMEVTS